MSFYQSGIAYEADNRLKPGLVCHAHAVAYNAAAGHRIYDFLGGEARYKKSLSTDAAHVRELTWSTIQRPRFRFALEARARLVRAWRAPPPQRTSAYAAEPRRRCTVCLRTCSRSRDVRRQNTSAAAT